MEYRESIDINLNRYLLMFKKQWMTASIIFAATVILSAVATISIKPSYQASGKLLFRTPSFQLLQGDEAGDLRTLVSSQNPINNKIEVISSPSFLQKIITKLQLKNKKGELLEVETLEKNISLKIIGGTDVLRITYTSGKPEEAALVVNTIMDFYLKNDILLNSSEAEASRQVLTKQIPKNQADVHLAEVALQRFKKENNILDITEEIRAAVTIIGNLDAEITNIKAQLEEFSVQNDTLQKRIGLNSQEAIAVSAISQSSAVQAIMAQIQEIDRQLAIERTRFLDNNPNIITLKEKKTNLQGILQKQIEQTIGNQTKVPQGIFQIGELKQNLIQNLLQSELQRIGLTKRLASLYSSRYAYEKRVKALPLLIQTQRELERKVETSQTNYEIIGKKIQELQMAEKQNTSNAQIIAPATIPKKPDTGKKPLVLVLGVMFGFFFSTTTVFFIEIRDGSIRFG